MELTKHKRTRIINWWNNLDNSVKYILVQGVVNQDRKLSSVNESEVIRIYNRKFQK